MNTPSASETTLRLLACVESFARDEEGAIGHDDWPMLARVLNRELAVISRLARERAAGRETAEEARPDPEMMARAEALHARFEGLAGRVREAKSRAEAELSEAGATRRRLNAVRGSYGSDSRRAA